MTGDHERPESDARLDPEAIALDPDAATAEGVDGASDAAVADATGAAVGVGTSRLREVIRLAGSVGPNRSTIRSDAIGGAVGATGGVPDGMASAVLAGMNPISGLYASAIGPIVGGLLVASPLLVVTSTSAGALSGGEAVGGLSGEARAASMYLLVLIVGLVQLLAGFLRLGRLTHFVSHSVMVGFLTGVASLIVLGQLGPITGTDPSGGGNLAKAFDVVTHPSLIQPTSLVLGAIAIGITIAPIRGGLARIAPLIAIAVPAVLAYTLDLNVETVRDVGEIPGGIPLPALPQLSAFTPGILTGAVAVAAIVLVQGAGVAQSFPPSGGRPTQPNRDFIAQGAANAAFGLFKGIPVGASVGRTALNVSGGARARWAAILSGVFMLVILVALGPLVEAVPMPALAGLLIVAGVNTIKVDEFLVIWRTGPISRVAIVATFVATLALPIQAAVGIGVLLSTLLYLNQASMDVSISELVVRPDGQIEERRPEKHLASNRATSSTSRAACSTPAPRRLPGCCRSRRAPSGRSSSSASAAEQRSGRRSSRSSTGTRAVSPRSAGACT